ncbi:MAG TPA: hypothetical protein VH186_06120 [Chloroflexia bacterium]|nr:hypothetical protein [Chloroflexia bacterium]
MLTSNSLDNLKTSNLPEYVPQSRAGRYWWLTGFFVALVALLLLGLTRYGQFQGEDFTMLGQLRGPKQTFADTLGFFFQDWGLGGKAYAPLPRLLFFFEYRFFTINPANWHIVSAILHAVCSVLVWGLAWKLTRRPALAVCAGLIFATLPAHVPVVAQIISQADLLAAIFSIASVYCFVSIRQNNNAASAANDAPAPARPLERYYYPLSIIFFALALLSKPEAIAVPLVLLAYDFISGGIDRMLHAEREVQPGDAGSASNMFRIYTPFIVLLVLYIAINLAFLGGLGAYLPAGEQKVDIGGFLRGNISNISNPFGLDGTDGLILLAALGAFLALTGVQEWEAWHLTHPFSAPIPEEAANPQPVIDDDDELDDPTNLAQNGVTKVPETLPEAKVEPSSTEKLPPSSGEPVPPYWTLRTAGYGFLWTLLCLLPFILQTANYNTLYLASAGFAIFLAAALAPFGLSNLPATVDREKAKVLFGKIELSYWLRLAAIIAVVATYFATAVGKIDEVNQASKGFAILLSSLLS